MNRGALGAGVVRTRGRCCEGALLAVVLAPAAVGAEAIGDAVRTRRRCWVGALLAVVLAPAAVGAEATGDTDLLWGGALFLPLLPEPGAGTATGAGDGAVEVLLPEPAAGTATGAGDGAVEGPDVNVSVDLIQPPMSSFGTLPFNS